MGKADAVATAAENWEEVTTRSNKMMTGGFGKQKRRNNVLLEYHRVVRGV